MQKVRQPQLHNSESQHISNITRIAEPKVLVETNSIRVQLRNSHKHRERRTTLANAWPALGWGLYSCFSAFPIFPGPFTMLLRTCLQVFLSLDNIYHAISCARHTSCDAAAAGYDKTRVEAIDANAASLTGARGSLSAEGHLAKRPAVRPSLRFQISAAWRWRPARSFS